MINLIKRAMFAMFALLLPLGAASATETRWYFSGQLSGTASGTPGFPYLFVSATKGWFDLSDTGTLTGASITTLGEPAYNYYSAKTYTTGSYTDNGSSSSILLTTSGATFTINFATSLLGTITTSVSSGVECQGPPISCPVNVAGSPHTRSLSAAVAEVPEPASWAMMVAGFGLAGVALRRRWVAGLVTAVR